MTAAGRGQWQPTAAARAARGELEATLDVAGWPSTMRLSRHLDLLLVLEELGE
jgi:hypothetical protein